MIAITRKGVLLVEVERALRTPYPDAGAQGDVLSELSDESLELIARALGCQAAKPDVAAEELGRAIALLRNIEWEGNPDRAGSMGGACPECDGHGPHVRVHSREQDEDVAGEHEPDCELAILIGAPRRGA